MKKLIAFFLISVVQLYPQETKIAASVEMITADRRNVFIINKEVMTGEEMEGFFATYHSSRWGDRMEGKLEQGGYSILRESAFFKTLKDMGHMDFLRKETNISGNMPAVNLTLFRSVFSFALTPYYYKELDSIEIKRGNNTLSPSANVFFHYIVYKMPDSELNKKTNTVEGLSGGYRDFDEEYNLKVKANGGNFLATFGYPESLNYWSRDFGEKCKLTLKLVKYENSDRILPLIINEEFKDSLLASLKQSSIRNSKLEFTLKFGRSFNNKKIPSTSPNTKYFVSNANLPYANMFKSNTHYSYASKKERPDIFDGNSKLDEVRLIDGLSFYYTQFEIPFELGNEEKNKKLNAYKTKDEIFRGTYKFLVVPINYSEDSLTVDLFIIYNKFNLNDEILRWTPIKKRIVIPPRWKSISVDMPKENWSANFIRDGEEYDLYGYSDYERYFNEYIILEIK